MERAAAESHGDSNSIKKPSSWSASANWIVSHGSLQDSISFDSSSPVLDDADEGAGIARDLLLLKPPSQDPTPCEVTICFRERSDIHRVYVRSTARVYEIYYSSEQHSRNNEYLCTVRCGAAVKESMLPSVDTVEVSEQMVKRNNNDTSDEDGWVEVKISDSHLLDDRTNSLKTDGNTGNDLQTYYEATAEILDASPCISVTLRLLSLQTSGCVFIEEIYIYADPVETADSGTSVNSGTNSAESSLLAMLVPSLLQLSKTGTSRSSSRNDLGNSDGQNFVDATTEVTEKTERVGARPTEVVLSRTDPEKGQAEVPAEVISVNIQLDSSPQTQSPHEVPRSVSEGTTNLACSRMEKVLDQLVSRVGTIESFCFRFEENMLKPLSSIETRLQRMEQQLDSLTARMESYETLPCSRITAPNFSFDESDSDTDDCNISDVASEEDYNTSDLESKDTCFCNPLSPTDEATGLASEICPGMAIKAPEFPNEDDDISSSGGSDSTGKNSPRPKASVSINSALASALEAFLSSASVKSPKCSPTLIHTSKYPNDGLSKSPAWVPCNGEDSSGLDFHVNFGEPIGDLVSVSYISSSKGSEEQDAHHKKCFGGSSSETTVKEVSTENLCNLLNETLDGRGDRPDDDSDAKEVGIQVLKLNPISNAWSEDRSSDLSIGENNSLDQYNTNWANESSMDSSRDSFSLRYWLSGQMNSQYHRDARVNRTMSCNSLTIDGGKKSHNHDKSKLDLEHALNFTVDFELPLLDVKFTADRAWQRGSPLEALLGETPNAKTEVLNPKDAHNGIGTELQNKPVSTLDEELHGIFAAVELLVDFGDFQEGEVEESSPASSNGQPYTNLL